MGKTLSDLDIGYLIEPSVDHVWAQDGEGAQPSKFSRGAKVPAKAVSAMCEALPKANKDDVAKFVKIRTLAFCYEEDPDFMERVVAAKRKDLMISQSSAENAEHYRKESDAILRTLTK